MMNIKILFPYIIYHKATDLEQAGTGKHFNIHVFNRAKGESEGDELPDMIVRRPLIA